MYTLFSDATGFQEGFVLAVGDNRLRLAVRGSKDAVELKRSQGRWFNDRRPVEIEFLTLEEGSRISGTLALRATARMHQEVA
ncbi:MAG: hypothetical protein LAP40_05550 [Acidobacteriia bacterium]|nr:hypothetical protein [Terriglobia bacterium]